MGVTGPMLLGRPHRYRTMWSMNRPIPALRGHRARLEIAACGGAGRRSAKIASAGMNQSREAHLAARSLHSPEGGQSAAVFAADWPHEGA